MRKLLFGCALSALAAMPAMAADLSVKAPVRETMAEPPFSWTGFYIGGHAGGGWSHKCFFEDGRPEGCHNSNGGLGGGQAGFNWQTGTFVFGVEFSGSAAGIHGTHSTPVIGVTEGWDSRVNSIFMLTGRGGFAFDRVLVYATGGGAWVRDRYIHTETVIAPPFTPRTDSVRENRTGWTIGGGVEWAITPNWSIAGQYNFVDLRTHDVTFPVLGVERIEQHVHLATARLNYRFGFGGSRSPY